MRVDGNLHTSGDASAAVRPYDAIRDMKAGLLLLSDAQVYAPEGPRRCSAVVVPREAIALIELPDEGWSVGNTPPG